MEQTSKKPILLAIVILLFAVALYIGFASNESPELPASTDSEQKAVIVEDTLATEGVLMVPEGFPEEIPIEEDRLLEAFRVRDMSAGTARYVLKYASTDTPEATWAEYHSLMTNAGYSVEVPNSVRDSIALFGTNGSGSLSVNITTEDNGTIVRLKYYER